MAKGPLPTCKSYFPIPRGDEFPFCHLVMDCIGPIVPHGDPVAIQPNYNYALVVIDLFSRWPMAYPLRSMSLRYIIADIHDFFHSSRD